MSADLNMEIIVSKGGEEAINAIVKALCKAEGNENGSIPVVNSTIRVDNGAFYNIWGEDYLSPDSTLYEKLAKAAPDAEWHAHSYRLYEGGGEGCEAEDDAYYKDHILKYSMQDSFDSLSFESLCELVLDPWGDVDGNIEDLRCRENQFFLDGRLNNQIVLNKLISDFIEEEGNKVLEEIPDEPIDDVFIISDKKCSDAVKKAKELGIPVLSTADFIAIFVGYNEFEERAEEADEEFDSSVFSEEYINYLTFDAVKLIFSVDEELTEEEFEILRNERNAAEMQLVGDRLGLCDNHKQDYVSIVI